MAQEIYFATNRRVVKDGADAEISEEFHPDIDELRFGRVSFTGKNLYQKDLDDFVGTAKITVAEEDMEYGDAPQKPGSKEIFKGVRTEMTISSGRQVGKEGDRKRSY